MPVLRDSDCTADTEAPGGAFSLELAHDRQPLSTQSGAQGGPGGQVMSDRWHEDFRDRSHGKPLFLSASFSTGLTLFFFGALSVFGALFRVVLWERLCLLTQWPQAPKSPSLYPCFHFFLQMFLQLSTNIMTQFLHLLGICSVALKLLAL